MFQKILLATDGSPAAERAADYAASIALRFLSKVAIIHAYTPLPGHSGEPNYNRSLYEDLEEAQSVVEKAAGRLRDLGVSEVETDLVEGPPANVILGAAETRQPDLIVMGARGLSTWQGMLMGSVSLAVTQRTVHPVLIVK